MSRSALLLSAFFLFFAACAEKPEDLIDEDVYIDLLVEFELLRTIQRLDGDTLQTERMVRTVLDDYQITYDQYERSYSYYMDDPDKHRHLYREAIDRLNQEVGKLRNPVREKDTPAENTSQE